MVSYPAPRRRVTSIASTHSSTSQNISIVDKFLAGQIVSGKSLGGQNVVPRQPRMIGKHRMLGHSHAQLAQYGLDREARAADHGLAAHNGRMISIRVWFMTF